MTLTNRYVQALKNLENGKSRQSIEAVYRKGAIFSDRLDELENLSEADYALFEKKMKGFIINRNATIFVKPDAKFFGSLAQRRGTKMDIAFFTFLKRLRPDGVWSAYIAQQTDYSGCTIYGTGILTEMYKRAKQFKRQYPSAYIPELNETIFDIKERFTSSTCACSSNSADVVREFRLFIKTFPKDEITPLVRKRLADVIKNKTEIRFGCLSG
ncbi:MAG: hypothetical protein M3525_15915 [Acidobacteriota bacterium]|nr:hypothetical protein [Acidobacteriota bacterium]